MNLAWELDGEGCLNNAADLVNAWMSSARRNVRLERLELARIDADRVARRAAAELKVKPPMEVGDRLAAHLYRTTACTLWGCARDLARALAMPIDDRETFASWAASVPA